MQAHAGQAGLSEDRVGEVVLAVHELAANAIAHGAGHGRLRMWDLGGTLSCEIVDGGTLGTTDSSELVDPCRPPTATACGWSGRWPMSWTCVQGPAVPGPFSPSRWPCRRIIDGWTKKNGRQWIVLGER